MEYSTGGIARITLGEFEYSTGLRPSTGKLTLIVTLDNGEMYKGTVNIDADDYKYELMEDPNYTLGNEKRVKIENMKDLLLNANYSHKDLMEFVNHINGDDWEAPF